MLPVWTRRSSSASAWRCVIGMPLMATMRSPPRMPARIVGLFGYVISTRPGPRAAALRLTLRMKRTPVQPRSSHCRSKLIVHAAPAARKMAVKVRPMAIRRAGLMTVVYAVAGCRFPADRKPSIALSAPIHDRHELLTRPFVVEELAAEHVGFHERRLLLHAAHHHAEVDAAHPDGDAAWLEDLLDRVGDVVRQVLLRLQPPHVHFDHARDLRRADDRLLRDVADDEAAEERKDVMRAERLVRPADDHEVVAALVRLRAGLAEKRGQLPDVREVVAAGHRHQRLRPSPRRVAYVLVLQVDMQQPQDLGQMFRDLLPVDGRAGGFEEPAIIEERVELRGGDVAHARSLMERGADVSSARPTSFAGFRCANMSGRDVRSPFSVIGARIAQFSSGN